MKNHIQSIALLFVVILTFTAKHSLAQSEDCRIRYSYDAAGNRIKREYKCITISGPYDPGPETGNPGSVLTVHPNPTTGVFHGSFSETVSSASFVIYASNGSVVQTYQLMQPAVMVTFDITAQVPGTYFLTVWALNRQETHTIIKIQ
jgi:hypothetical protein